MCLCFRRAYMCPPNFKNLAFALRSGGSKFRAAEDHKMDFGNQAGTCRPAKGSNINRCVSHAGVFGSKHARIFAAAPSRHRRLQQWAFLRHGRKAEARRPHTMGPLTNSSQKGTPRSDEHCKLHVARLHTHALTNIHTCTRK